MDYTPLDFGWVLTSNREYYDIKWFEEEQTPNELEYIEVIDTEEDEMEQTDESDSESDSSDSEGVKARVIQFIQGCILFYAYSFFNSMSCFLIAQLG